MSYQAYDAAGFVDVRLTDGAIISNMRTEMALVPLSLLASCAPGTLTETEARKWGEQQARHLATQLREHPHLEMTALAQHLQSVIALMGLGIITLRLRDDALLMELTKKGATTFTTSLSTIVESVLSGFISTISGIPFSFVVLEQDDTRLLLFGGNPDTAKTVSTLVHDGMCTNDALTQIVSGGRQ